MKQLQNFLFFSISFYFINEGISIKELLNLNFKQFLLKFSVIIFPCTI